MATRAATWPSVIVRDSRRLVRYGVPWVFSNEVETMAAARQTAVDGVLVRLVEPRGDVLGTAFYNRRSNISARVLWTAAEGKAMGYGDHQPPMTVLRTWLRDRLRAAVALRTKCLGEEAARYCRLVHAEGDGMPGLAIDRFDRALCVQINSLGFDGLKEELVEALKEVVSDVETIVLRLDSSARELEGLPVVKQPEIVLGDDKRLLHPEQHGQMVFVEEDKVRFPVDLIRGQKTGWFYDMRPHRLQMAQLSRGARVLDLFCHTGGFGIHAAVKGAKSVVCVDTSQSSLDLAVRAALLNNVEDNLAFRKLDAQEALGTLSKEGDAFDVIVMDPPPYVRSQANLAAGIKMYGKIAGAAMPVLKPNGLLFVGSCSHSVTVDSFIEEVSKGIRMGGRSAQLLSVGGAGMDHPVHPSLPQTSYLKTVLFRVQ